MRFNIGFFYFYVGLFLYLFVCSFLFLWCKAVLKHNVFQREVTSLVFPWPIFARLNQAKWKFVCCLDDANWFEVFQSCSHACPPHHAIEFKNCKMFLPFKHILKSTFTATELTLQELHRENPNIFGDCEHLVYSLPSGIFGLNFLFPCSFQILSSPSVVKSLICSHCLNHVRFDSKIRFSILEPLCKRGVFGNRQWVPSKVIAITWRQCLWATSSVMEANLLLFKTVIAGDSWGTIAVPVIENLVDGKIRKVVTNSLVKFTIRGHLVKV